MARFRQYQPGDDSPREDGDLGFIGVDERGDPSQLPPGYVAKAVNKRFRFGVAEDRLGISIAPWMLTDGRTPFPAPVHGAGIFSDPNGEEWILVAANGSVYKTRPSNVATSVPCVETVTGDVEFVQAFDVVLMFRGFDADPLVMASLEKGFTTIAEYESGNGGGTGTLPIPRAKFAEFFQNRLLVAGNNDIGYVSDVQNYTRYKVNSGFRINQGSDDSLVRFFPFGRDQVVAFKDESVYVIGNVIPDERGDYSTAYLGDAARSHGLLAPRTVVDVGRDIYYLSTKGVTSLRLSDEGRVQAVDLPLSDKIQKTIGRMHPKYAANSVAAYWDNKLFVAVPLDDAELLGPELIDPTFNSFSFDDLSGMVEGDEYRFASTNCYIRLSNGETDAQAIRRVGATTYVKVNSFRQLYGGVLAPDTRNNIASLRKVLARGVNNAILVYDFISREWSGYDYNDSVTVVQRFLQTTYQGQRRLFSMGPDGYLRLHFAGLEDEVPTTVWRPYVDIILKSLPQTGDTIQIGGGTVVTASRATSTNSGTTWGVGSSVETAAANLFAGYDFTNGAQLWTSGHSTASSDTIESIGDRYFDEVGGGGVRLTRKTTTAMPAVTTTGTWAAVQQHVGTEFLPVPIQSEVVTRGYAANSPDRKRVLDASLLLSTWAPNYSITAIADGVAEEESVVSGVTRDRLKYTAFNTPEWNPTNDSLDHEQPGREDYSIVPDLVGFQFNDPGFSGDLHQDVDESRKISIKGKYVQLKITNADGRCDLRSVRVEQRDGERRHGRKS